MKTDKKSTLYLCDPQKNTECQKRNCQMPNGCFLTTRKEERSISVEIIAYLYDRAKDGDDEAFRILQRLFNS